MKLFAYLDPGTGTLIVQAVLGGTAGVAVLFKTLSGRRRKKGAPEDAEQVTETGEAALSAEETQTPPISTD